MITLEMKKASYLISGMATAAGILFLQVNQVLADVTNVTITNKGQGLKVNTDVGTVIGNGISILFVVASLLVLFYLIMGGINWITSGGDKEKVGKARGMIINALIGLAVLALAFVIWNLVGKIVNVDTNNLQFRSLDES